jgi:hypothetical protein
MKSPNNTERINMVKKTIDSEEFKAAVIALFDSPEFVKAVEAILHPKSKDNQLSIGQQMAQAAMGNQTFRGGRVLI